MSKKNKNGLFSSFHHLAIAKRITLLYGGIFTLSLLFLSGFMILNISSMQQSTMRRELVSSMQEVQQYLDEGKLLSDAAFSELLDDSYVPLCKQPRFWPFRYRDDPLFS